MKFSVCRKSEMKNNIYSKFLVLDSRQENPKKQTKKRCTTFDLHFGAWRNYHMDKLLGSIQLDGFFRKKKTLE